MQDKPVKLNKGRSYAYIITIQWQLPYGGFAVFENNGEYLPPEYGTTEMDAYRYLKQVTEKAAKVPEGQTALTLFYRLVPNRRLARKWER